MTQHTNEEISGTGVYSVAEIVFRGPAQNPTDVPTRDIDFWVRFQHESGSPTYKIHGFWDGDGRGGISGEVFKVRFCPTSLGRWEVVEVYSNAAELYGQRVGHTIIAEAQTHPGFWRTDLDSPGQRWYMRSDNSHQYICGNTHYSFLSGYRNGDVPTGNDIAADIKANAKYFKKLRFSLYGDHYPHPNEKPFFDGTGNLTDSGDFAHRPNPKWFSERADLAVQTAHSVDLIADIILAGPDCESSRTTLKARSNGGDPTPFLKYIIARYGGYPNVWFCLCNEFDLKKQTDFVYTEDEIAQFGQIIREFAPYPTPVSVHASPRKKWSQRFDELPEWYDHLILQKKLKQIAPSADAIQEAWENPRGSGPRNKPTINDELSYQGKGDKHIEGDTIESHLGAFLGGGYGTTGEKPGNKLGHYFWGKFNPAEHTAAAYLKWLREIIDTHITFWKMAPDLSIFDGLDAGFRGMGWHEQEYVLGTNRRHKHITVRLPLGTWTVKQYDVISREATTLSEKVSGRFVFDAPQSRAVLFHFKKNSVSE